MKVQLLHPINYIGWETYDVDVDTVEEAAYKAVRQTHDFLTDTNHTHEAGDKEIEWGG